MSKKYNVAFSSLTMNQSTDDDHYAQLNIGVRGGYPRITVFLQKTKKFSDTPFNKANMIVAPFDFLSIGSMLGMALDVVKGEPGKSKQVACKNTKWVNGEKTNELEVTGTVEIGKTEDGVIYWGLLREGKQKVKFDFLPKDGGTWHQFFNNGSKMDSGALSVLYATAYFNQAKRLLEHRMSIDATNITELQTQTPTFNSKKPTQSTPTKSVDTTSLDETDLF